MIRNSTNNQWTCCFMRQTKLPFRVGYMGFRFVQIAILRMFSRLKKVLRLIYWARFANVDNY